MNRLITVAAIALAALGCSPKVENVSIEDLDLTITTRDESMDFSPFSTYSMPDSVLVVSTDENTADSFALEAIDHLIIDQIEVEMTKLGYSRVDTVQNPDVGIVASRITKDYTGVGYLPGWCSGGGGGWWGYPGYGWCYPGYGYEYSYKTGSIIIDMIDINNIDHGNGQLKVLWHMMSNGYLNSDGSTSDRRVKTNITRGFEQSQYLKVN
ncbi:DUF4136 domain-containing protein [Cyclobacteriaceae bacterium]|nr:DUF4136 domain-containing protein [Cyclobacteriaceae bacterium]